MGRGEGIAGLREGEKRGGGRENHGTGYEKGGRKEEWGEQPTTKGADFTDRNHGTGDRIRTCGGMGRLALAGEGSG